MADRRRIGGTSLALLALAAAAGCAGGSSSGSGEASSAPANAGAGGALRATAEPALGAVHGAQPADLRSGPVRLPSAVIKTADVRLRVPHGKIQAVVNRIGTLANAVGGITSRSNVVHVGGRVGTIAIRVPSARFQKTLIRIGGFGQVQSQLVQSQDVTQQFVDLNARLVNLREQERVLRRLMNRATTVSGSILVESQLTQVQLQIEELTGRVLYLQNRASLSTIAVTVVEAGVKPPVHHHASTLWKAGRRALDGTLGVIVTVIVGLGYVLPLALLALLVLGAVRLLAPRLPRPTPRERGPADA
jgi:uncharacterized protein DUF4349